MENIKENIAKFLQCNTVNLYACIQDKDNVISYREIRLWNTAIEVFTQHFSAVLQKMYLSECKLISIDELFSTGLYQARKLRKMYLNSYMRELHGIVNLDEIKETVGIFDKKDSDKIHALIIEYRINNDKMWLYQRYSVNKTLAASKYLWFFAKGDVFDVQKKLPNIYISTKIDALIINGHL